MVDPVLVSGKLFKMTLGVSYLNNKLDSSYPLCLRCPDQRQPQIIHRYISRQNEANIIGQPAVVEKLQEVPLCCQACYALLCSLIVEDA